VKILHQINYIGGLGADRWIGNGFKDAFEDLGHEFFWLEEVHDFAARIRKISPDILMIAQSKLNRTNLPVIMAGRKRGMKVVLRVDSFFDQESEMRNILIHENPADLYYGEVENPWMGRFKEVTRKPYSVIANAAHERQHIPGKHVKKYECDIVFLGAMMPNKREALEMLLLPLKKKYKVKIYGPNWTLGDNAMRLAGLIARKVGLMKANEAIQNMRLSVPVAEEKNLYASAKIAVNIHERGDNIDSHVILNERTFKIPACGGFEICDFVPPLRNYFAPEEMVMADNAKGDWVQDWFEKIDYYVRHDEERKKIQEAGTRRALEKHTYIQRVQEILKKLEI